MATINDDDNGPQARGRQKCSLLATYLNLLRYQQGMAAIEMIVATVDWRNLRDCVVLAADGWCRFVKRERKSHCTDCVSQKAF